LVAALSARPASAHDADVIYVEAMAQADGGIFERITLTGNSLVQLAPHAPAGWRSCMRSRSRRGRGLRLHSASGFCMG
jgi:hypothetical protein